MELYWDGTGTGQTVGKSEMGHRQNQFLCPNSKAMSQFSPGSFPSSIKLSSDLGCSELILVYRTWIEQNRDGFIVQRGTYYEMK